MTTMSKRQPTAQTDAAALWRATKLSCGTAADALQGSMGAPYFSRLVVQKLGPPISLKP